MTEHHSKSTNAAAKGGAKTHSAFDTKPGNGNGHAWPFAVGHLPESMKAQTEAWIGGQTELLAGLQSMTAERMKRCQDGSAAALQSFQRLCACKNGTEALSVYQEWLANSMNFVMADLTAAQEQAARMAQMSQRTLSALSPTD